MVKLIIWDQLKKSWVSDVFSNKKEAKKALKNIADMRHHLSDKFSNLIKDEPIFYKIEDL